MGKSAASCFRIITCASDSVDQDDLPKLQSKVSSDQRGWSFRKRSVTPRVLSSTAISESPSFTNKESSDSTAANLQVQPSFIVPEKNSVIQWKEEKCELSAQKDTKPSDALLAREDDCRADATLDESSIILIQSTIRGYLARRMLLKQKNIIKLQAAVRGYLVRRDAVGTSKDITSTVGPLAETYDNDSSLITFDADNLAYLSTSLNHPMLSYIDESHSRYDVTESVPTETRETNLILKVETGNEQDIPNLEKFSKEQPETEAKGVSAQSKFEELSLATTAEKSATLCSNDSEVDSNLDTVTASTGQPFRYREMGSDDSSISNVQVAGSECGTELSISSTLDSPDRSEFNDLEQEPKMLDVTDHSSNRDNVESSILGTESVYPGAGDSADSPSLEKKLKVDESNTQVELGSQATPSSKVSLNTKKSKGEKSESNRKNRSSPSHISTEPHKTGKRRNSPDSARDSNSSNPLPSYMQATESARAKSLSDRSPVSSPDVVDKDILIKKRQSLSGSNGRQISPRVHRPVPQNAKGNGIHSPQDRKWQR